MRDALAAGPQRALLAALVALNLAAFGASLRYGFVWDDELLIVRNPVVSGPRGYLDILTHDMWWFEGLPDLGHGFWRPLTTAAYRLLFHASGGSPLSFHAASVALHAVNAALLFALLCPLAGPWPAFAGAAFFSLHPLRVESVDWISGAGDVHCGAFLLLAVLGALSYLRTRRVAPYVLSLLAFQAALLCKEIAFLFPLWLASVTGRRRWRVLVPYVVLAAATAAVRSRIATAAFVTQYSWHEQVLTFPVLLARYMGAMIAAGPQVLHSAMAPVASPLEPRFLGAIAALAALAVVLVRMRAALPRQVWPPLLWALLALAPVCVPGVSDVLFAERYTYLPALGLGAALAIAGPALLGGGQRVAGRWRRLGAAVVLLSAAGAAAVTAARGAVWRDQKSLFTAMARQEPRDTLALHNLGIQANRAGHRAKARGYFERVLVIDPTHRFALYELGALAAAAGATTEAETYYRRAAAAGSVDGLLRLAELFASQRRYDDAERVLSDLRARQPGSTAALVALGDVAAARGDTEAAAGYYEAAIAANPGSVPALYGLAMLRANREQFLAARTLFERVVSLDPRHSPALNALGILRRMAGDSAGAYEHFRNAVAADPANVEAVYNLAVAADDLGDCAAALDAYTRFLDTAPESLARHRPAAQARLDDLERRRAAGQCP